MDARIVSNQVINSLQISVLKEVNMRQVSKNYHGTRKLLMSS